MNVLSWLFGPPSARRTSKGRWQPSVEALEGRWQPSTTSLIASNFNGNAIHAGDYLWFNSVAKVTGLGSSPVHLQVVNASIDFTANGTAYHVVVPNVSITFSPTATSATTNFDSGTNSWVSTEPPPRSGNFFLDGVALKLPGGLPGGINPVNWQATFQTDTAGVSLQWQWSAAVYTNFTTDYHALDVKPVDDNQLSVYKNSDHAGTPEAFKPFVIGGARGGGGSNWTGSYSGTAQVTPALVTQPPPPSSVSGTVFADNFGTISGLGGVTITLSGTDTLGNAVSLTTVTDSNGNYSFGGLQAGTYTIRETTPPGFVDESASAGSLGGTVGPGDVFGINVGAGVNGSNYNFREAPPAT
jgi:hypothetical protein